LSRPNIFDNVNNKYVAPFPPEHPSIPPPEQDPQPGLEFLSVGDLARRSFDPPGFPEIATGQPQVLFDQIDRGSEIGQLLFGQRFQGSDPAHQTGPCVLMNTDDDAHVGNPVYDFVVGNPAPTHARQPPSMLMTFVYPIFCRLSAASADRNPPPQ
jgi:hypothetical protein